ncbi:MAG: metallophosphoesterase [Byssovorax sp.]
MLLRFLLFALITGVVLAGASSYFFRRLVRAFALGPRARRALAITLGLSVALAVGSRLLGWIPRPILEPIQIAAYIVLLTATFAAVILGAIDLARLAASLPLRALRRIRLDPREIPLPAPLASAPVAPPPAPLAEVPRRVFLAQATVGSAVLVGAGSSLYGTLIGRRDYALTDVPARIPGLSRRLDGYTIVQLSDLHIGTFIGEAELRAAEDLVRRGRPDLIILTGDLIDHDPRHADALARFVRRLGACARDGVVAIPGNHDYATGLDEVRAAVTGAGAKMLINDGLVLGEAGASFALLGVDDVYGPRTDPRSSGPDLDRALAAVPDDLPRVLLCHNPQFFPKAAGRVALQLSGHTHGGQISVGPGLARLVLGHPFVAGAYELQGSSLYVNRGFGTVGPPARIGSPPEVSRIVLTT